MNVNTVQPDQLWNAATAFKYPFTTRNLPSGKYTTEIKFFDQVFSVTDTLKNESQRKVTIAAAEALFGIHLTHWDENFSNAQTKQTDKQKFEKARLEAIKVCHNRAKGKFLNKI